MKNTRPRRWGSCLLIKPRLLLLLFSQIPALAQTGVVRDSVSKLPVSFANVMVANSQIGVASNENGEFSLTVSDTMQINVSSIGYQPKTVKPSELSQVLLVPVVYELEEVSAAMPQLQKQEIFGAFKMRDVFLTRGSFDKPWQIARYFNPTDLPKQTPFLSKISLGTISEIKGAKFKLHILDVNDDASPGGDLIRKPIVASAKKGRHKTQIDVSEHKFTIPDDGFFIAIEWILTPENRYVETVDFGKEKKEQVRYMPSVATEFCPINNSWGFNYSDQKWTQFTKNQANYDKLDKQMEALYKSDPKTYKDMYLFTRQNRTEWEQLTIELLFTD